MAAATFEDAIVIASSPAALFELTQDYSRRLEWDPFLKVAELRHGATAAGLGVRAWCVARSGIGMETEYVSFQPPERTAVRMTEGPFFLGKFSGSWVFTAQEDGRTRVTFRYNLVTRPAWLGGLLRGVFSRDTTRRLHALKAFVEDPSRAPSPRVTPESG